MATTNPYTSTRICKDCGKVMTNVCNTKLYCPECAKKRHDEQTAAWWANRNADIRTPYQRRGEARKPASGTQRSGMQSSGQIAGQRMPPG